MEGTLRPDDGSSLTSATTLVLVFSTVTVVVYFIYQQIWGQERWEKYGVKQATFSIQEVPTRLHERLIREHGPTVGMMRDIPVMVTRDLDLIKQILIKDFNNFVNRNDIMPSLSPLARGIFFLFDQDWKRIRQLMSPSFSTGKLKRISSHVQEAAISLTKAFEQCAETGSHVKLLHSTGQYTTSIIAKTAFGFQADCIGDETDDQFTHWAKNVFKKRTRLGKFFLMPMFRFRELRRFLIYKLGLYFPDPCTKGSIDYFTAILEDSIGKREEAERQGSHHKNNDFLQNLVSTKIATDTAATQTQSGSRSKQGESGPSPASPKKTITKDEVIAQSVMTILAAYETTSSTLQFCLYLLAKHPDIQERVYEEISANVEGDLPSHEELNSLRYLEQVVNETLRLFPPLNFITRVANQTRAFGHVTIPAGAAVTIPIREVHRDPANFPDPLTFDPERFGEEAKAGRNPLAFIPFGQGPRLCIGMRLAYLELKTALVHLLRKVKVELNRTTVPRPGEELEMDFFGFPRSAKPIELAVTIRSLDLNGAFT